MGRKRTWEEASLDSAIDEVRGGASEKEVALGPRFLDPLFDELLLIAKVLSKNDV